MLHLNLILNFTYILYIKLTINFKVKFIYGLKLKDIIILYYKEYLLCYYYKNYIFISSSNCLELKFNFIIFIFYSK